MQYIIMANGQGTRWNNFLGISKQEAVINGERLIDRTVRLIKEKTKDKVYILSSNKRHDNDNAIRIVDHADKFENYSLAYDYINEETVYLYGDTYYEEEAIDAIINLNNSDILFFGNESAIVGIKVFDYEKFKDTLNTISPSVKSLYREFDKSPNYEKFVNIGYSFYNINTPDDYIKLKKELEISNAHNKRKIK